jgi:glycolate oxidase FAD binding subunit
MIRRELPPDIGGAAEALRGAAAEGLRVRPVGGGTKLEWAPCEADVELATAGLAEIVEHNAGDLTAVVQAGVPLARAQEIFAATGQMLSLDPPDGGATIGGVVATGDSGPLRHRYGGVRDLIIGATVALSDGTVARSGGKVIKNVAGYDLAKLVAGSFGTLGLILEVAMRLHPLPRSRATAVVALDDADELGRRVLELSHAPLELEALDVRWRGGGGALLARFAGARAAERADLAGGEVVEDDESIWADQRAAQAGALRVAGLQTDWPRLIHVADRAGGSLVGRAGLGLAWIAGADEMTVREEFPEQAPSRSTLELMRRVRARFDPAGVLNPGVLVT